jgi:hypothetical protein
LTAMANGAPQMPGIAVRVFGNIAAIAAMDL